MSAIKLMAAALQTELSKQHWIDLSSEEAEAVMAAVIERAGKEAERFNEEQPCPQK